MLVTGERNDIPALPRDFPADALLGLKTPAGADWARVRGIQHAGLADTSTLFLIANAVAGLVAIAMIAFDLPLLLTIAWGAALGFALWQVWKSDGMLADADRNGLPAGAMRRNAVVSGVLGAVWSMPAIAITLLGGSVDVLVLWTISATLIAAAMVIRSSAPAGTAIFVAAIGVPQVAAFLLTGDLVMAAASIGFVGLALVGIIRSARSYLKVRVAEAGVAEKDEVVSMLLREFEEGDADWLWQIDRQRRIHSASPRFAFALGGEPAGYNGTSFIQAIAGKAWETGQFPPSLHDLAERLKSRASFSNLLVQVAIGAQRRWWELSGTPVFDQQGKFTGFRGVGSDVTEQRESSEKIARLARYDTLTGLPNRLMLTETLADAMKYAEQWRTRCAFLMLDLDRFKSVNDSLGHLVGDQLLASVSDRLQSLMGDGEMVGRLGGDEFAIVIRDAGNKARIEELAQAVIGRLSEPYEVNRHTLYVGASVGSAFGPRDGDTVEMLMRNADLALYRAKDEGGSAHFAYKPELHAHAEERRKLEIALRGALERDELTLDFQPVVDAQTESIASFEALLRWNSRDHGFVSPAKFIPLAEDTRLIVPIGEWVMQRACEEATRWPEHVRVAVNVSGEQLLDPAFSDTVVRALSMSGLAANRLEIEVTESIFLRDGTTAGATLEQIKGLGCSVALDDFGTGYSSLGYLRKVRFSTIKVDRSFVQGASAGSDESLAIIKAVVALADSLEMNTTAEGVETEEEAAMIRALGCNKIQGYYFGRPMGAADALALFRRQRAASA